MQGEEILTPEEFQAIKLASTSSTQNCVGIKKILVFLHHFLIKKEKAIFI